jgi:carbonic anhydrase/acetyltransferase-like protein (isoleucine patch superfamily)
MAVLRADGAGIRIGEKAAVLDLALLEAPEDFPVWIEEGALISHGALIHGARIQARSLVGVGAIVLDGAVISTGSIIGAGSLITANTRIPPNSLVLGTPGRVVRETTGEERQNISRQIEGLYEKSRSYMGQE